MENLIEFIKELRHNREINFEKDLENRVDIDYVLERLGDCVNMEVLELLDVELEDDETDCGGVPLTWGVLRDFMIGLNIPFNISLEDLNRELQDCGIKPLKTNN